MRERPKRIPARFFKSSVGNEPVREWLKSIDAEGRRRIGEDIKTVEYGWPIGMPLCRNIRRGLWEVRTGIPDGIARVFFCVHDGEMILLHGFVKKSKRTPQSDLDIALKRMKDVKGMH